MSRVVVIGSINQDIVARTSTLPRPGETMLGRELAYLPGGKGANQAVAAARSGASTTMVGALGQDAAASMLEQFLQTEHIDTTLIKRVPGPSGTALIAVDDAGENAITIIPGANNAVDPALIDHLELTKSDVILLQNEIPEAAIQRAITVAHAARSTIIYNLAPFRPIDAELEPRIDYLILNETEFAQLLKHPLTSAPDQIHQQLEKSDIKTKNVIVTLGSAGLCARFGHEVVTIPGHKVAVVDSTGAGDCFCGVLVAAVTEGQAPVQALHFANAAAALAVQHPGAGPAMPHRAEITHYTGGSRGDR